MERRRAHFERAVHASCARRASGAATSTWPGTSRSRASESLDRPRAPHPRSRRSARWATRNLARPEGGGRARPRSRVDRSQDLTASPRTTASPAASRARSRAPCFLTNGCAPGGQLRRSTSGGCPQQQGTTTFQYYCHIPRSALDPAAPPKARPSLYGHGLLGNRDRDRRRQRQVDGATSTTSCSAPPPGRASPSEDLRNIVVGDRRPVELQHRGRPHAAGLPAAAVPRPGADPPAGPVVESGLPEERPERDRHAAPVLRRQLAGRHHGRSAHRARARLSTARCSACRA